MEERKMHKSRWKIEKKERQGKRQIDKREGVDREDYIERGKL
jgi:hypothetical protein